MMINYEQASIKSIRNTFSLYYKHNEIHLIIPAPNLAPSLASSACPSLPSCFRISLMRERKYKTLIFNISITIMNYVRVRQFWVDMSPWITGSKHFSIEALYFAHALRLSPKILLDMASVGLHNPRQDSGTSESSQHFVAIASTSATPIHKRILYYYSLNQSSGILHLGTS